MIQAANKNYVIKALGQTKQTQGGIIVQTADETELAEVISVGPDVKENAIPVGTRIVINWNSTIKVKVANQECFIIHADHVLGTVND